jgi:hypothetical protein
MHFKVYAIKSLILINKALQISAVNFQDTRISYVKIRPWFRVSHRVQKVMFMAQGEACC